MEWPNYTTKETLKDNDELMILDKDANANKRTLMDKIWDYVVDKMTTAVIAKLGTTNKTLIGAVNELNSKSVSSIQKIKTQQNQICTFNVKEHDFLIVTFSADNASKSSCYICTINNKGSLLIVIDKNQVDDGYKIESISCDKFVLTIKTSVFGGSLKVITI